MVVFVVNVCCSGFFLIEWFFIWMVESVVFRVIGMLDWVG